MNLIKNLIKNLAISIINTALTIFICYWNIMAIINAFQTPDADWNQVWTYLVCSVVILVIMWISAFLKFLKRLAFVILVLLLIGWFYLPKIFFYIKRRWFDYHGKYQNEYKQRYI